MDKLKNDVSEALKALGLDYPALLETTKKFDDVSQENVQPGDIKELQNKLWKQEELIRRLTANPLAYATILAINPTKENTGTAVFRALVVELKP